MIMQKPTILFSLLALLLAGQPAAAFIPKDVRKRYSGHEVRLLAFADILGQKCGLKPTAKARQKYDKVIMRSIRHGEKKLNIFQKYYYRAMTAEHNPRVYVVSKWGRRTTYAQRPGDGLHLLVNEVVKNIYLLPCEKIIKRAKSAKIFDALFK